MTPASTTLRPLGLGEVLDRAVTLCVTYFVPLTAIFIVYALPYAVIQYFASADLARIIHVFTDAVSAGSASGKPADPAALSRALGTAPGLNGWYPLLLGVAFCLGPLPAAALIEAASAFYLRRATSFGAAYRVALARWLPLLGINALFLGAGLMLYFVAVLLSVAIVLGLVFLTASVHALGIALAVMIGLAVFIAGIAFFIVATLALQVSYFTCVVEGLGAVASFARGIRRVVSGVGLRRSLLVGCAFAAIGLGVALVAAIGEAVLLGLIHSRIAGTAFTTLVRIATATFTTAFIAVFYFDLRVREEGYDLQLAAEELRPT